MLRAVKRLLTRMTALVCTLGAATVGLAATVQVDYTLSALAGAGRYAYHYTLTNLSSPDPVSWFSVDFDPALYDESSLLITSTGLADWSEQLLVSIPVLGVPAQYDAYKGVGAPLAVGASQAGFVVEFTWLGNGTPGRQMFTLYDPNSADVLETGLTTGVDVPPPPGVPEPASWALLMVALCGLAGGRRYVVLRARSSG